MVASRRRRVGRACRAVVADDNDLIEKEWVNKAKEIVERTRESK